MKISDIESVAVVVKVNGKVYQAYIKKEDENSVLLAVSSICGGIGLIDKELEGINIL